MFVSALRSKQHANKRAALIEDTIPLPSLLQLRSKSYLEQLYTGRYLSVREIANLTDLSYSVVLATMDRFGIPQNGNGHKRPGQTPFGFEYIDYQLKKSKAEQEVIRMIRQYRAGGLSLRQIAGRLNQHLVPAKNAGSGRQTP